tara:strand:+ start:40 stop:678 length:639 start_codon:yes stop_codon:yes gene_type:complete
MITLLSTLILTAQPTTAAELALGCVCHTHPDKAKCKAERRADVTEKASDLLAITAARQEEVPESMRLILLAVACSESGMKNRPTCGGRPGCNDNGTSGGMFQIKLSRKKPSLRWLYEKNNPGKVLDVYDHKAAGAFYLGRLIWGVHNSVRRVCGWRGKSANEIWSIAAIRLGAGPFYRDHHRKRVQRCAPTSRYAALALRWHRKCPTCWKVN